MVVVRLEPMTQEQYDAYRATAEEGYAESMRQAGAKGEAESRAKAAEDYARLLPDGLATPGQLLWTAYDGEREVGILWVSLTDTPDGTTAFGYDLEVPEDLRRHGYGRAILEAAVEDLRARGVVSVGLNVFGHNLGAQALYEQMGFEVTAIQMVRRL